MIISVASGKGGTGKTTVATSLALSLGKDTQLADCDVEAPNVHLFVHPEFRNEEIITVPVPKVDESRCTGCGKCVEICRFNAIVNIADTIMTFPELCHGCGGCQAVCPAGAIEEGERIIGVIQHGLCNGMDFLHGRLRIGEAMAPPLIRQVRSRINPDKTAVIDAPPGTSCPVIAAIKDTDFVVLVAEPTPFGLNDLELAIETVKILKIPAGLIINRSDIGDMGVADYAARENIPVLMEIPYDRNIAEAYCRGEPLVEAFPQWRRRFVRLCEDIDELVAEIAL
ncbi:MAG: ATP-binding protein [Desulfobacteraceae bacterium]|nr:ATP-binding protein [Desulfobacteraceae bacterium]